MKEDPRELARRLVEEAKRRHQGAGAEDPPPGGEPEDPRKLARRLANEAKQREPEGPRTGEEPSAIPAGRASLTAAEALALAREQRRSAPPPPERRQPVRPPAAETDLEPTTPIPGGSVVKVARLVSGLVPDAQVVHQVPVQNFDVFRALWRSHLARARQEHDLRTVAVSTVLLDAMDRLDPGQIVAVRIAVGGAEWAGWVDLHRELLLGVAQPADVYLAGA